ncbi:MAG: hypothetical protein R2751_19680 [Bacteroidales bacterium]
MRYCPDIFKKIDASKPPCTSGFWERFFWSLLQTNQAVVTDEEAYRLLVEEWKEQRLERLKDKHGWLSLAGLYWLEEGENRFGSDPAGDTVPGWGVNPQWHPDPGQ